MVHHLPLDLDCWKVCIEEAYIVAVESDSDCCGGPGPVACDLLFQVTWLEKTGFIYDPNNLPNLRISLTKYKMAGGWQLMGKLYSD
ncbi:Hypothetical predicted protein [Olea europaea subsp. europaea]|uniref:Uncharacterized protein n=1 Tax=Olea europaea subsp. europaea TaxID=158383 RepID=A0A8S0UXV7_OLEEU|nr:Hypothetical predicted protein [Olea europaea subsp. europaea]